LVSGNRKYAHRKQREQLPAQKKPAFPLPSLVSLRYRLKRETLTVPVCGIDLIVDQNNHEYGSNQEDCPSEDDSLGSESGRRCVGDDTVGQWSSSKVKYDIEEPTNTACSPSISRGGCRNTKTPNSKLDQNGDTKTEDVNGSSTESPHDEPSDETCAYLDGIADERKGEGVGGIKTSLLEKV